MVKGRRKRGKLSEEDQRIWESLAQTVTPLKARDKLLGQSSMSTHKEISSEDEPLDKRTQQGIPAQKQSTPAATTDKKILQDLLKSSFSKSDVMWKADYASQDNRGLEPRTRKQISRGHKPIEAKLDLHGKTQDEAHQALRGFIHRCRNLGQRHVIVVTGKGKSAPEDPYLGGRQMGVLRQQLPNWLQMSDLKPLIVGFEPAARHHGGEGAFYIHIRKKGRGS